MKLMLAVKYVYTAILLKKNMIHQKLFEFVFQIIKT